MLISCNNIARTIRLHVTTDPERLISRSRCYSDTCRRVPYILGSKQGGQWSTLCLNTVSCERCRCWHHCSSCRTHGATFRRTRSSWTLCGRGCSGGGRIPHSCPGVGSDQGAGPLAGQQPATVYVSEQSVECATDYSVNR